MKFLTLIVLLAAATFTVYAADFDEKVVTPDTVAISFAHAYLERDIKTVQSLYIVPFYLNGDVYTIEDRDSLDKLFADVFSEAGVIGGSSEDTVELGYVARRMDDIPSLDDEVFPEYVAFRIFIPGNEEYGIDEMDMCIVVYVSTDDEPKVIGLGLSCAE